MPYFKRFSVQLAASSLAILLLAGCANSIVDQSQKLERSGKYRESLSKANEGLADKPNDNQLRAQALRAREMLTTQLHGRAEELLDARAWQQAKVVLDELTALDPKHPRLPTLVNRIEQVRLAQGQLDRALKQLDDGQFELALASARTILETDPMNRTARDVVRRASMRLSQAAAQATPAAVPAALSRPVTIEFREAPLRSVFEALTRIGQINFVFDRDVRADSRVTVFLRDTPLAEAIRIVLQTQQLASQQLNNQTYMIYPATQAKNREYLVLEARSYYLSNIDAKQAQAMVRAVVKTRDTFIDERLNLLVVKDTPEALALTSRLIQSIDVAEAEVVLDIEVIEVSRSKLLELGIKFPTQISYGVAATTPGSVPSGAYDPSQIFNPGTITPSTSAVGRVNIRDQLAYFANPSLLANLRATDARSNLLSNPSIRVRNREKAKIHIGEKLPVFTTNFTGATTGGTGSAFSSSVSYLDVGLKLDVEPQIHLENEVAVKLNLEVSSVRETVQGPANSIAYRIGTRNTGTVLRLQDGETQILAGLISDSERSSSSRVPGLGELPLLGRLFSNTLSEADRSEIVLLITPRIVRSVDRPAESFAAMGAGTEAAVGIAPIRLTDAARSGVALGTGGGTGPAGRPAQAIRPVAGGETNQTIAADQAQAAQQAAADNSSGQLTLNGPPSVKAGNAIPLTLQLEGAGFTPGTVVELSYDEAVFSGGSGGRLLVGLSGSGTSQSAQISLRAGIQAGRSGSIRVIAVRNSSNANASEISVGIPGPLSIEVTP